MFNKSTEYALRAVIYIARDQLWNTVGLDNVALAINSLRSYTSNNAATHHGRWAQYCFINQGPGGGFI
ncbi:MAG: hypothetical protein IPM04_04530 [Saprospiraceae bacterium]|nr:hypothetical protein [Candidatus Brachybacter algidus]MBK8747134.1 hypothetical protein [Candidatus Brachybacter algidus]